MHVYVFLLLAKWLITKGWGSKNVSCKFLFSLYFTLFQLWLIPSHWFKLNNSCLQQQIKLVQDLWWGIIYLHISQGWLYTLHIFHPQHFCWVYLYWSPEYSFRNRLFFKYMKYCMCMCILCLVSPNSDKLFTKINCYPIMKIIDEMRFLILISPIKILYHNLYYILVYYKSYTIHLTVNHNKKWSWFSKHGLLS